MRDRLWEASTRRARILSGSRLLPLALAGLLFWQPATAGKLDPAEKMTLELEPGVVLVAVTYQVTATFEINGQVQKLDPTNYTVTGSGFIYRPDGYIITNGHVVADANMKDAQAQADLRESIRHDILIGQLVPAFERATHRDLTGHEDELAQAINLHMSYSVPELKVYLASKAGFKGEIKAYSDPITMGGKDVAIVKIDANNLPTVKLGDSSQVHIQEPMRVIGYPGKAGPLDLKLISLDSLFVPTVTNGHISAVKFDYKGSPVIQSDAAITHGNSGGPAFNDAGEVIGIATFGPDVAGFNFFVPINTAKEFVASVGAPPQSGLFDNLWQEALDTYDAGKFETSKKKLDDVLRIMPNEPDATRLYAAAEAGAANEGPIGRLLENAGWIIWTFAGVLVLLVIIMLIMVMARGKAAPAPVMAGAPALAGAGQHQAVGAQPQGAIAAQPAAERSYGSIQVTSGSLSGRRFPLTKAGLLIGRDSGKCQVVFTEDVVSGEHAWIVPVDNGVVVIDRGSSNGTFINSVESPRVSKVGLQNGDRVYLGKKGSVVLTYFAS
jgi:S1-C subfamily serine protease